SFILRKSRMRKRARTDLCGGRSAMVVPTATTSRTTPQYATRSLTISPDNGLPPSGASSGSNTHRAHARDSDFSLMWMSQPARKLDLLLAEDVQAKWTRMPCAVANQTQREETVVLN